jgi:hypothetical protein
LVLLAPGCAAEGAAARAHGTTTQPAPTSSDSGAGDCASAGLLGTSYDVSKSRFAFGSVPVQEPGSEMVRYVGAHGAVAIFANGFATGIMNGGAPEASLADFSEEVPVLSAHVRDYFTSFGVRACQISSTSVNAGSEGRKIQLGRAADGITVAESLAFARFDVDDETTVEGFYWPTIPDDVIASARTLRAALADPAALRAYKAKLPADAQGDGSVVIHHSAASSAEPFESTVSYDVGGARAYSFDAAGNVLNMTTAR